MLTGAFLLAPRRWLGRRSFLAGTAYGISTAVLPLLVMFPSMGYGWSGLRSGEAGRLLRVMLEARRPEPDPDAERDVADVERGRGRSA